MLDNHSEKNYLTTRQQNRSCSEGLIAPGDAANLFGKKCFSATSLLKEKSNTWRCRQSELGESKKWQQIGHFYSREESCWSPLDHQLSEKKRAKRPIV